MGGSKATKRLEEAERRTREVFGRLGVKPSEGQLAGGVLRVLQEMDEKTCPCCFGTMVFSDETTEDVDGGGGGRR